MQFADRILTLESLFFITIKIYLSSSLLFRLLGSSDVLHGHVCHQLMHGAVRFGAKSLGRMLRLQPLADELLLDRLPHVPEKRTGSVVVVRAEVHVQIESTVAVQRRRGERMIGPGARHLTRKVVGAHVHFTGYSQAYLSI